MSQIEFKNVAIGYEGKAIAININFCINNGDYVCIIGENGVGKSTLLKALLNLNKQIKGEIIYNSELLSKGIGYLSQENFVQKDFPASVEEIVLSGLLKNRGLRPFYNKKEKALAKLNMDKLEIFNLRKKCYRELSGGQRQRVLLARALCSTENILVLDEPVSGLDVNVVNHMYSVLEKLNREYKITVVMITHDIEAAKKYASHIIHINKDKKFNFITKEEYISNKVGGV